MDFLRERKVLVVNRRSICECERQSAGGSTDGADNELLHLTDSWVPGGWSPVGMQSAVAAAAAAHANVCPTHVLGQFVSR